MGPPGNQGAQESSPELRRVARVPFPQAWPGEPPGACFGAASRALPERRSAQPRPRPPHRRLRPRRGPSSPRARSPLSLLPHLPSFLCPRCHRRAENGFVQAWMTSGPSGPLTEFRGDCRLRRWGGGCATRTGTPLRGRSAERGPLNRRRRGEAGRVGFQALGVLPGPSDAR